MNRSPLLTGSKYIIVALMFAAGALLYGTLPDMLPSHWNFEGVADSFQPKNYGTWFIPGITLLMAILFPILKKIDPKRENYEAFAHAWDVLQLCIIGFMGYVYAIQLYIALHPDLSAQVGRMVVFGIGILFIILGNYMGKIRQNFFIGLRTPWTLSDPEVWQKSQRFAGWMFVMGGILIVMESILWLMEGFALFAIILLVAIVPIIYSYLLYRGKGELAPKVLRSLLLLGLFVFLVAASVAVVFRLITNEDSWMCVDGQWIEHGHPSSPMPALPCE